MPLDHLDIRVVLIDGLHFHFIIDGGSGLRKAIRETSGGLGLVQRCQVHYADQRIMPSSIRGASWNKDVVLMRSA